jgi:hypothetical protein
MARRRKKDEEWKVRVGDGGWLAVDLAGSEQLAVQVRLDETGRFRIHQLHLRDNGEPVSADRLRALRLAGIEGLLNLPAEHAAIQARLDNPPAIDITTALRQFTAPRAGRVFEKSGVSAVRPAASGRAPSKPSRGYTDPFYERVADVYRSAFRRSGGAPVMAVADEWNVPRSTAARWVKEARRRKKLGPAPAPGKKGE